MGKKEKQTRKKREGKKEKKEHWNKIKTGMFRIERMKWSE